MCGRFILITDLSEIAREFNITHVPFTFMPDRNIAPGRRIPALIAAGGVHELTSFLWGLIPFWAKDPSIGAGLINARAETVLQKPSFKHAFLHRRCLIPADGFYEWKKEGRKKIPFCFGLKYGAPMYFAGLYERWTGSDKKQIASCTIITTAANSLVAPVHDRMPVIVPEADRLGWLDARAQDRARLLTLMKPYPAQEMSAVPAEF